MVPRADHGSDYVLQSLVVCVLTCSYCVSVFEALFLHAGSQLDLKAPREAFLWFPQGLQFEWFLVISHRPKTLPPPLIICACLSDNITQHILPGVFFFQTVPEKQKQLMFAA